MNRVYVLFHETNTGHSDESDGYIEAVYSNEAAAESSRLSYIRKAIADGEDVYYNPDTDESFDHWDHDWHVEEWNVQELGIASEAN